MLEYANGVQEMITIEERCPFRFVVSRRAWWMIATLILVPVIPAAGQWPQWGGPHRNFAVEVKGLADSWPEDGPKRIWRKNFGYGHSSV
ncbi:MAG: hypothetical protein ACYTFA_12710, partial [Planctomycetota bacterium]